jgi:hypothetical protein
MRPRITVTIVDPPGTPSWERCISWLISLWCAWAINGSDPDRRERFIRTFVESGRANCLTIEGEKPK